MRSSVNKYVPSSVVEIIIQDAGPDECRLCHSGVFFLWASAGLACAQMIYTVSQGEMSMVVSCMRRNARWASAEQVLSCVLFIYAPINKSVLGSARPTVTEFWNFKTGPGQRNWYTQLTV